MAELPLQQGIARLKTNEDRIDRFANGTDAQDFVASDGTSVPSLRKFLKNKNTEIDTAVNNVFTARDDAVAAGNLADSARATAQTARNEAVAARDDVVARQATLLTQRDADILVTVGSGGNFTTINAAIKSLAIYQPVYKLLGITAEIRLLAGFVMNEQVLVKGVDLSWITIKSSNNVVIMVNPAGITQSLNADSGQPVFGAISGGKLPVIGVQFEYSTQQTGSKVGVAVLGGSSVEFLPGSGVRKAGQGGLVVYHASEAFCTIPGYRSVDAELPGVYSVDFSYANGRALDCQHGSRVTLPRSKWNESSNANDVSVYGIWGVFMDLTQAQVRNSKSVGTGGGAVRIRDGSYLCMREGDVSGSLSHGIYASHAAIVDFRQKADGGITGSLGARNCAYAAIFADGSCKVEATDLVATGCCTAAAWTDGAITANGCSSVMADVTDVSNSGGQGFHARNGSIISAAGSKAQNCASYGIYVNANGQINFGSGSATGCRYGVYAEQGGSVEATSADFTGCTVNGVYARRGARLSVRSCNCRMGASDAATDIVVAQGAIIDATASAGGLSKTQNVVDGNGLIFK